MSQLGVVAELWRYPVSSIGGEQVSTASFGPNGVIDDRRFALVDRITGAAASPEREPRWRAALQLSAVQPKDGLPTIRFPDGEVAAVDDGTMSERLSDHLGFHVSIGVYDNDPALRAFSRTVPRHEHFPAHILTTASMDELAAKRGNGLLDSRRFRPTALIKTPDANGFQENGWLGSRLRMGEVTLFAEQPTKRCGMTFIAQPGLSEDPEILRSIVRHNRRSLGVNCTIHHSGVVKGGDPLTMEG